MPTLKHELNNKHWKLNLRLYPKISFKPTFQEEINFIKDIEAATNKLFRKEEVNEGENTNTTEGTGTGV